MRVLVVTQPGDYHANAVKWAIGELGGHCDIFYPLDVCGVATWSYSPGDGQLVVRDKSRLYKLEIDSYDSVWMRRVPQIYPLEHLTDIEERSGAETELEHFSTAILKRIEKNKFVVNPIVATRVANRKPFQLSVAAQSGFTLPRTLVSNDPEKILAFFEECGRSMVYKPLKPMRWRKEDGRKRTVTTTLINDINVLLDANLSDGTGIFQEKIEKVSEIRATVMGRSIFAWEKTFVAPSKAFIDWRVVWTNAIHRRYELPDHIANKCFEVLSRLGLVFGCFDIAVDAIGRHIFLEVNPQGQWLSGDHLGLEYNQLRSFADFIMNGNLKPPEYVADSVNLRAFDALKIFERDAEKERRDHFGSVLTSHYNLVSMPFKPAGAVLPEAAK